MSKRSPTPCRTASASSRQATADALRRNLAIAAAVARTWPEDDDWLVKRRAADATDAADARAAEAPVPVGSWWSWIFGGDDDDDARGASGGVECDDYDRWERDFGPNWSELPPCREAASEVSVVDAVFARAMRAVP